MLIFVGGYVDSPLILLQDFVGIFVVMIAYYFDWLMNGCVDCLCFDDYSCHVSLLIVFWHVVVSLVLDSIQMQHSDLFPYQVHNQVLCRLVDWIRLNTVIDGFSLNFHYFSLLIFGKKVQPNRSVYKYLFFLIIWIQIKTWAH